MFQLDTDVVSELRKARAGKADRNVTRWAPTVPAGDLLLSVIAAQEPEISVSLAERRESRPRQKQFLHAIVRRTYHQAGGNGGGYRGLAAGTRFATV